MERKFRGGNTAAIASLGNLVDGDTTSDYYNSQDWMKSLNVGDMMVLRKNL